MEDIKSLKIGIIGAGALGGSIALALNSLGYEIPIICSRSRSSADYLSSKLKDSKSANSYQEISDKCNVIFITTPDKNIKEISDLILWKSNQIVIHCSGVSDLNVLSNSKKNGASIGSMHPLYPFSDMDLGSKNLKDVTFGIDGDDQAIVYIKKILADLESIPIEINSDFRALYHLSGVMAGNLLLGLGSAISDIWEKIGLDRSIGSKSLIPMMINSCENILKLGIPNSMAGPYVRGDAQTIKMHLDALKKDHSELLPLYIELAKTSIKYSNEKVGLEQTQSEEILKLLELYS
ncbi:MAG: Rossmann-like and DUF2520 domain-containing protein [Dehalococcoidia bacterium]